MGFFQDAWDDIKGAASTVASVAKPVAQVFAMPATIPANAIAHLTGSKTIEDLARTYGNANSFYNLNGLTPQFLEGLQNGNFGDYRTQLIDSAKVGAVVGAGAGLGTAAILPASSLVQSAANGKVDSKALFNTLDPSGSAFGDSLGLQDLASLFGGNLPKSTSNPYVYSTGAAGGYSSGYDSSYIKGPPQQTDWLFYGIMAAGAALILFGGKGK